MHFSQTLSALTVDLPLCRREQGNIAEAYTSTHLRHPPAAASRTKTLFDSLESTCPLNLLPDMAAVSPSSSPRLPSPPPIPEVQFGPQSPGMGDISKELSLDATSKPDEGSARRIRPGTRAADMALGPSLVPLSQVRHRLRLSASAD